MWELQNGDPELIVGDETLMARRYGEPVVDGGIRQPRPYTEFAVTCMVTPMSGRDLMIVPEGDRDRDQLMLYSIKAEQNLQLLDLVDRDGWYQVQSVADWGSFAVSRIMRVDVGQVS